MAKANKFGIMIKAVQGSGYFGQYQFYTFLNENNEKEVFISDDLNEVDTKLEKMINGDYRKKDLLVVDIYDFNAFADLVENANKPEPTPTPEPEPEPDPSDDPSVDPAPEPTDAVSITGVTATVDTEAGALEAPVTLNIVGENLPEDGEYQWVITCDEDSLNETSTGPILTLTGEKANTFNLATNTSAVITVGEYTSESIQIEAH